MSARFFFFFLVHASFYLSNGHAVLNVCEQHRDEMQAIRNIARESVLSADRNGAFLFKFSAVESSEKYVWRIFGYRRSYSEFSEVFKDYLSYSRPPGLPFLEGGFGEVTNRFYNMYTNCIANHGHLRSYFERGMIYFDKGLYEHCMEDIKPVVESGQWHTIENEYRKHELLLVQGMSYFEIGEYENAVNTLTDLIAKDPNNKTAFYNRALAYFEMGNFDLALKDYLLSGKSKQFASFKSEFSEHVGLELLKGIKEGNAEWRQEFLPSICRSMQGIGACLWQDLQKPIALNLYVYAKCVEFCKEGAALIQSVDKETIETGYSEFIALLREFDSLTEVEKAHIIGRGLGKHGPDFFLGGLALKCFSGYKKIADAIRLCNLEALARNNFAKQKITRAALEYHQRRQTYINNLKVHWGRQNKHIPGKHNYEEGKSILKVPQNELEQLLRQYAGKGRRLNGSFTEAGYKEKVDFQRYIGDFAKLADDKTKTYFPTTQGVISYAKDGTVHMWPCEPKLPME